MEDLKPETQVINGICYRINPCNLPIRTRAHEGYSYEEDELYCPADNASQSDEDDGYEIEEVGNRHFRTSLHVPSVFFPHIVGAKGNTKRRLQTETGCQITIPKPGQTGDIVVTGVSRNAVGSGRRRVEMIISSARSRQSTTHFISFHLSEGTYIEGYNKFKALVLETCSGSQGVTEEIFTKPHLLHLTLCALIISDGTERSQVVDHLNACHQQIIQPFLGGEKLKVLIKGLDIMNDDPTQVGILYAKVSSLDGSNKLQELSDKVSHFFMKLPYISKRDVTRGSVKLHMTLLKARRSEDNGKLNYYDASSILKNYEDFTFGDAVITSVELCVMSSSTDDKYYTITSSVDI